MSQDKIGFAIPKCFFCQKDKNEILMNTKLSKTQAAKIESMHGVIVDMVPCQDCEEIMAKGIILISVKPGSDADFKKGEIPNPYRTGGWCAIKDEAVHRMVNQEMAADLCQTRWAFVPDDVYDLLGLPRGELEGVPYSIEEFKKANNANQKTETP